MGIIYRQTRPGLAFCGAFAALAWIISAGPAHADCASYCQGDYWACIEASDSSTCGTQQAICVQRCISTGEGADNFGAIAFSSSTEKFGYSYDYPSQDEAESRAVGECHSAGGADDCEVVVWFNAACAALATDGQGTYGAEWARTQMQAEAQAMSYCKDSAGQACTLRQSLCTK